MIAARTFFRKTAHGLGTTTATPMLPKMNRLNEIRASKDGPKIPKGHKKQCNIWDEGNPLNGDEPSMHDFPTDSQLSAAWDNGVLCAQDICTEVGMAPEQEPEDEPSKLKKQFAWFYHPHLSGKEAAMLAEMADESEEQCSLVAVNEIHAQLRGEENEDTTDNGETGETDDVSAKDRRMFSPMIKIPGESKYIYKSTLVSLLNSCPDGKLSKDRLVQVKSGGKGVSTSTISSPEVTNYRNDIGLHSDIAILRKENSKYIAVFGRVQRIIKKSGRRGHIEYRKPISLNDKENNINIRILATAYTSSTSNNRYRFNLGKT